MIRVEQSDQNGYHPASRTLLLRADASSYARWHELEHARQHEEHCWQWLLWSFTRYVPWVRRVTRLLVEIDARNRVQAKLQKIGAWSRGHEDEAKWGLLSYWIRLWIP